MRRLKTIGLLLTVLSLAIIVMSTVLPFVKLPQAFVAKGPSVKLSEVLPYWIDTWVLPPIDAGTPFTVNIKTNSPGGISIIILPYQNGEIISGASPLLTYLFDSDQQTFSSTTIILTSSEYIISIVSMTNFTLTITSKWSPFYGLKTYLYFGLGFLPAGLLIIYYDRLNERKERILHEALKD